MPRTNGTVSRRDVLKLTGGSFAAVAAGAAGQAVAESPDRKIIGLTADAGFGVASRGARDVHREIDFGEIGKAVAGKFSDQAVEALENNPNVRYVETDGQMQALGHYNDYYPWGINRVDADVAHDYGYAGSGGDVAVVDTGIDAYHGDLQANLGNGADFTGSGSWNDDNGHGTHVAGTVGAVQNGSGVIGVGHEITLHAVKVLDSNGGGSYSDIADGIRWAADQGHDAINLSLGGGYSSAVRDAVRHAYYNRGALVVAAAGNDGCYDCVGYPAAHDEAIAVSAINQNDRLASFSSYGPEIELAAPGKDVWSTWPGDDYRQLDGTSMASPHVAGAGAHLMTVGYNNTDARSRLNNTAENLGLASYEQGNGLVDVGTALGLN
ncbi:peptidase S8 [Halobacteriales archaeon QS_1_68_20]|nr:MAG: peptidase S8 [Halobacteriales archaeon QS_1_68_20]